MTQTATPETTDFTILAYKQQSAFKNYASKAANTDYSFDVRDAVTNQVLASYDLQTPNFHNVTLAVIGDATTGLSVQQINNFQ